MSIGQSRQETIAGCEMRIDHIRPKAFDNRFKFRNRQDIVKGVKATAPPESIVTNFSMLQRCHHHMAALTTELGDEPFGVEGPTVGQDQDPELVSNHSKCPNIDLAQ